MEVGRGWERQKACLSRHVVPAQHLPERDKEIRVPRGDETTRPLRLLADVESSDLKT